MSITGLGSPVVPLENGSSATADGAVACVAAGRHDQERRERA